MKFNDLIFVIHVNEFNHSVQPLICVNLFHQFLIYCYASSDADFFGNLVVEAANTVKIPDGKGGFTYPIKQIHVLKANGKSTRESTLVKGFALNCVIATQGLSQFI